MDLSRASDPAVLAQALQGVTSALAGSLTRQDVLGVVVGGAHDALGAHVSVVYLMDEERGLLVYADSRGMDAETIARRRLVDCRIRLPLCDAVRDRRSVWVPDRAELSARYPDIAPEALAALQVEATMAAPLLGSGRTLGGMAFSFRERREWADAERRFVQTLADQCAQALDRARLYDEVRESSRRLEVLAHAGEVLASTLDWDTTLRNVVDLTIPAFADFGFFDVVEPGGQVRRIARAHENPPLQAALDQSQWQRSERTDVSFCALSTGRTGFHPTITEEWLHDAATSPDHLAVMRSLGFCSMITVPVRHGGGLRGSLTLFYAASGRHHTRADVALVEELARRAGAALENARLHREVQEAVSRRAEADRRKDEFLAMLGHELRNPLAPATTALELMRLKGGDVLVREREVIERQLRHLARLVDDLLDVSRITRGKVVLRRRPTTLAAVVARAAEVAAPVLEERGQHLRLAGDLEGLVVDVDEVRMAQVVSNLLTNAARYSERGRAVELRARREEAEAALECVDEGIGIERDMLPHVFDVFVQGPRRLDRTEGGLGLGLAVVRSLTELHGGRVRAESDGPGRGSRFTLWLPLAATSADAAGPSPRPGAAPGRRVLLVDDNVDAAATLGELLRASGHEVLVVHDAPRALAAAPAFGPTTAVLDVGLPVMDGYELGRRLRDTLPGIRLVALTGYGQDTDRERRRAAGFAAHLVKPVASESLLAALAPDAPA